MVLVKWKASDSEVLFGTIELPIKRDIKVIAHTENASEYVGISFETTTPVQCTVMATIPKDTYYFTHCPTKGHWLTLELVSSVLRDIRDEATATLTVTVATHVLDGDELSQERLARAYTVLGDAGTIQWKTTAGVFVTLTGAQVKEALGLAGQAQSALWIKYSL